jgi:hypothetical protein
MNTTPQLKNAFKVGIGAVILLAFALTVPVLAIILAVPIVPYMIYKGFFVKDAPFPKPWDTPKF